MNLEFQPDVAKQLHEQMIAGNYASENDVLRDALAALSIQHADVAAVEAGISDMEQGHTKPLADIADNICQKNGWANSE